VSFELKKKLKNNFFFILELSSFNKSSENGGKLKQLKSWKIAIK
jgi:hypothetical protein